MEISPQHHSIVLGKQSNNLRLIMQRTSTQIIFPDAGDPNIPNLKKSNVTITGTINNVYIARQQLIGSLPLVLMFDLPEFSLETVESDNLTKMMQKYDVFINVRHKPKQNSLSVIIKGVERNATNIYETRRKLLNIDEPIIEAIIPSTCNLTNAATILQNTQISTANNNSPNNYINENYNNNNLFTRNTPSPPSSSSSYTISPMSPTQMGLPSPPWNFSSQMQQSLYSPLLNTTYAFNNQSNTAVFAAAARALQTNIINQQQHQQQQQAINLATQNLIALNKQQNYKKHPPGFPPHPYQNTKYNLQQQQQNDNKDNHYLSLSSGASSTMSSPAISPRNISPICISDHTSGISGLSSEFSDVSIDRMSNDSINNSSNDSTNHSGFHSCLSLPYDYENKKIQALKALQNKPNSNEFRVPTPTWSGYGLSQTMPALIDLSVNDDNKSSNNNNTSDIWDDPKTPLVYMGKVIDFDNDKDTIGMTSTYLDHTPTSKIDKIISGTHDDLATSLTSIGLDKYIRKFFI